ncbi:MAG TPA: homoserine dehydrogenase [Candidatus Pelagibacter bacterium]|jgi:homoserine dehydrogenase|nr:homoserine dehydrogenase [Pelagibacteraceae bacterium]HJN84555.1 homoserine dehydrogenase [Candidatus Pelagibacter bacterium]|tara:strand:+ start:3879 stop:5165 length:1287 start_codon:yes stop_codon:yes gene_type:complete
MKKIGIGIVGLGNIGSRLYKEIISKKKDIGIKTNTNINIVAISAKNINKKRSFKIRRKIFFKNPLHIAKNPRVNILIELIGKSDGISKRVVESALINKKHVITANKALISKHGDYLTSIAEKNKVNLEFEAAVCGGIPVLRTIKEGLATNKISKVYGILNGTCNYILSEMEATKDSFKNVLKKAQNLGYAEPTNPKLDLNGYDAMAKIKILSSLAFNKKISNTKVLMEGIENIETKDIDIANQLNLRIKLLGITELINNKLYERVHPCLLKKDTYIANVNGVMNAVVLNGSPVGESILQGEGAGPGPTSSALMSDLLSILRGNIKFPFGIPSNKRKKVRSYDKNQNFNSLYLRLEVKDKPGVLSQITKQLAKYEISIARLIQNPDHKRKTASIIIITHKAKELNSNKCLKSFKSNKNVLKSPTLIRLL